MTTTHDLKFDYAIKVLLEHEGGLSDDKHDPGGITNFGITIGFLKEFKEDINGDGVIDSYDVRRLTKERAIELYKKHIWDVIGIDRINDTIIATKIFDMGVDIGMYHSIRILQQATNLHAHPALKIDGRLGSLTVNRVNSIKEVAMFHNDLRSLYRMYYVDICKSKPKMKWALHGWLIRAEW